MQIMDGGLSFQIMAESPNSGNVTASCKVEKLERSVRYSSVLIAALGMSLIALAVYTAVLVLTESRSPQLCVRKQCVGTDFGVVDARNASTVNKNITITNKNTTLIEDTDFGVVDARNASTVNKNNTITNKNTKLIENTAARILQNLNKDVDPCTDFYEFACGGWIKQNPMPVWATTWDVYSKLEVQVKSDLRELLEAEDDEGLPNSVVKAKSYYRTCMSNDPQEKLAADWRKSFQKLLQEIGLPLSPSTNVSANFSWEEVAARGKRQLNLDLLLKVWVAPELLNTTWNRVWIGQGSPWPKSFKDLEQYRQQINDIISSYEYFNEINATQFADHIVNFSKHLYDIMNTDEEYLDLSVQQLKEGPNEPPPQWKQHDWDRYLKLVFSNTSVALQDPDSVYVWNLPYLRNLSVLLANTEPVIIENYLWWMVYSKYGSKWDEFLSQNWMQCINTVNDLEHFGHALSYLYVKRHFDYTSTKKAIEMLDDVRSAFAAAVQKLDWLDTTTRQKTLDKLTAMKNLVGFPAWLLTPEQLDKYYEDVEVVEGNIFETYLKLTFWNVKRSLQSLREKPDRSHWEYPATTVNAFYLSDFNSVTIPAAILQPPFYGNGIEAIDYGSIGATLGHEVTHGFDTDGRCYDKDGNWNNWWSEVTTISYESRVQCIIDQYNKYHTPQPPYYYVNGSNTQNDNIADNGGLRAALHAYQLFAKRAPADSRLTLPGLPDYKPDQLFFLGFAQTWCGNSTIDALKTQMAEDEHSPNKFRVIGTLSNSKEFADAWSCPAGSPMNPEHKCVLW